MIEDALYASMNEIYLIINVYLFGGHKEEV